MLFSLLITLIQHSFYLTRAKDSQGELIVIEVIVYQWSIHPPSVVHTFKLNISEANLDRFLCVASLG